MDKQKSYMDRIKDFMPDPKTQNAMSIEEHKELQKRMCLTFAAGTQYYMNKISYFAAKTIMPGDVACFRQALEIVQNVYDNQMPEYARAMLEIYKEHADTHVQIVTNAKDLPEDPTERDVFLDQAFADIDKTVASGDAKKGKVLHIAPEGRKKDAQRIELPRENLKEILKFGSSDKTSEELVKTVSVYTDQLMDLLPEGTTSRAFFLAACMLVVPMASGTDEELSKFAMEIMYVCSHVPNNPFAAAMNSDAFQTSVDKTYKDLMSEFPDDKIGS